MLAQVDLVDGFLDEPQLVVSGQAGASHLLGGRHGQIGHFLPDLLQRLVGVALDLLAGLGQGGLGLHPSLFEDLRLGGLAGLAGPVDDGVGLLAGFGQLLLVVGEQFLGLVAQVLGVVDGLVDLVLPRLLQPHQRIEGELVEQRRAGPGT